MLKYKKEIYKEIFQLAWPALLTNIVFILFDIGDRAIIGRLSLEKIASSSIISNYIFYITGSLGMLSMAFIIIATASGEGVQKEACEDLRSSSMGLAFLLGLLFLTPHIIWGRWLLENVYNIFDSQMYLFLVLSSITLCINLLIFIFSAYFRYILKPKIVFVHVLISSLVNLFFDYVLAFGKLGFPALGVIGVVLGSVIGLLIGLITYIIFYIQINNSLPIMTFNLKRSKTIICTYIPLFVMDLLESSIFYLVINLYVAQLSEVDIGVYTFCMTLMGVALFPVKAISSAAALLYGQNKKNYKKSKAYYNCSLVLLFLLLGIIFVVVIIFGKNLISILTNQGVIIHAFVQRIYLIAIVFVLNALQSGIKYFLLMQNQEKWVCNFCVVVHLFGLVIVGINYYFWQLSGIFGGMSAVFFILYIGYTLRIHSLRYQIITNK